MKEICFPQMLTPFLSCLYMQIYVCDVIYICVQMCIIFATRMNVNVIYMKEQQQMRSDNLGKTQ